MTRRDAREAEAGPILEGANAALPDPVPADPVEVQAEAAAESAAVADVRAASGRSAALLVAAGIFLSRVLGLVRERAVSHFFGLGPHADVLRVALRTPNFLQNLLGEGTVSAAFIPVYSRMLAEGRPEAAGRFAGAVLGLLVAVVALCVALGMMLARPLLTVLQPGWLGDAAAVAAGTATVDRLGLAVETIRYTFPMAGVLVLFAWGLGVLNSHRRFFLPYVAPVAWNAAIIAAMAWGAFFVVPGLTETAALDRILFAALVGALVGGFLQFGVLLPAVAKEMRGFRFAVSTRVEGVRESLRAFGPVVLGRGAYQISGYVDLFVAGFLAAGAISAMTQALTLYVLPVSLFGMSVAASELPELSRMATENAADFRERIGRSLRQILWPILPATVAYLGFGGLIVGAFFETGRFGAADTALVALALGGYALGLPATTASRLLQNVFYALSDTRTPARLAVARLVLSTLVGVGLMLVLEPVSVARITSAPGAEALRLGAVGLALGASVGAWVELALIVRALRGRVPGFGLPLGAAARLFGWTGVAAVPASALVVLLPETLPLILRAALVLAVFGAAYLAGTFRLPEAEAWVGRLRRGSGQRRAGSGGKAV